MFKEEGKVVKGKEIVIKIPSVEEWTISSLKHCCKRNKIKGYAKMSRDQLIEEVKNIIKNI